VKKLATNSLRGAKTHTLDRSQSEKWREEIQHEYKEDLFKDYWWYGKEGESAVELLQKSKKPLGCNQYLRWRRLALYYLEQLNLFSEMCLGRSYKPIYWMQDRFSYTMLTSMMANTLLPDSIRSAFTIIMLRVWVDRYPHAEIKIPSKIQVLTTYKKEDCVKAMNELDYDKNLLPQYHCPLTEDRLGPNQDVRILEFLLFGINQNEHASDKFYLVIDFLVSYLESLQGHQNPTNSAHNKFLISILEITNALLRFGFFGNYQVIKQLAKPLFELLDGKSDEYSEPDRSLQTRRPSEKVKSRHERTSADDMNIMSSKQVIIKTLLMINKINEDYRLRCIIALFCESLREGKPLLIQKDEQEGVLKLSDRFQGQVCGHLRTR
jgi:hypothetical protein